MSASRISAPRWATVSFTLAALIPLASSALLLWTFVPGLVAALFGRFSVGAAVWDSMRTVLGTALVAFPPGLAGALFLRELAAPTTRRRLKPAIEVAAAVPTVVWGWFALVALAPALRGVVPGTGQSAWPLASLTVGLMVLPTFLTLADDALAAVPQSYREAAYALGADRWTAARWVVLPAAAWGLTSAAALAMARAMGEAMIVLVVGRALAGAAQNSLATLPASLLGAILESPGNWAEARALGGALLAATLGLGGVSRLLQQRSPGRVP